MTWLDLTGMPTELVKWAIHVQTGPGEIHDPCLINSQGFDTQHMNIHTHISVSWQHWATGLCAVKISRMLGNKATHLKMVWLHLKMVEQCTWKWCGLTWNWCDGNWNCVSVWPHLQISVARFMVTLLKLAHQFSSEAAWISSELLHHFQVGLHCFQVGALISSHLTTIMWCSDYYSDYYYSSSSSYQLPPDVLRLPRAKGLRQWSS